MDIAEFPTPCEICNNADDDCNGFCDEGFPDVAVTNPACSNRHAAAVCNNGAITGTHCYATGASSAPPISSARCAAPRPVRPTPPSVPHPRRPVDATASTTTATGTWTTARSRCRGPAARS
jgi:hypothetical protein